MLCIAFINIEIAPRIKARCITNFQNREEISAFEPNAVVVVGQNPIPTQSLVQCRYRQPATLSLSGLHRLGCEQNIAFPLSFQMCSQSSSTNLRATNHANARASTVLPHPRVPYMATEKKQHPRDEILYISVMFSHAKRGHTAPRILHSSPSIYELDHI